jgi:hypothetical protein
VPERGPGVTEKRDKPEKRPRKNAATLLVEIAAEL